MDQIEEMMKILLDAVQVEISWMTLWGAAYG